jgi:hypothetical protein
MVYVDYVRKQSSINRRKFALTSLTHGEVRAITRYYRAHRSAALLRERFFGLCLGIRNGAEVRALSRRLGRRIIGIDISETVLEVPNGFWCDFGKCPDLWAGKVDFLYSNSYDHALDLDVTLAGWRRLLAVDGLLFLQFTPAHANDLGISADALRARLTRQGFDIVAIQSLPPSHGLGRAIDTVHNVIRQIGKRLVAPALPTSSQLYWSLKHNLRRGIIIPTQILIVAPAAAVAHTGGAVTPEGR